MTVLLPDLGESMDSFLEQRGPLRKGLVIEVAAIHEGMTANFNLYPATELAAALPSWTSPYPKPVLLHHDPYSEAVGRVIGSRMDKEDDGTPYTRLQIAITDNEAIKKVVDQRYLTGSVGGKAGTAKCSVCQADWSKASMFELPCKHQRGKTYKGQVASIEMGDITFKEYSFVNMPADQRSGVRAVHAPMESESAEEDFRPARFFCLDMQHESVTEFGESERDVLGALRPQEASALYLGLKGAFLSALAEDTKEKNGMPTDQQQDTEVPPEVEEEEDVLAVAEGLSEDLSQAPEEEGEGEESGDGEGDGAGEGDEETPKPEPEPEPEPQPEPDPAPEPADDGDGDGEGEESEEAPEASEESEEDKESDEDEGEGEPSEEEAPEEQAPDAAEHLAQIAALTQANESLTSENARLKLALKRGLAERVVDMKIALGLSEFEEREGQLGEHLNRSAASLADSLRDLSAMPRQQPSYSEVPKVTPTAHAVGGDEREPVVEIVSNGKSPKPNDPEEIFVDVLMGRRPL